MHLEERPKVGDNHTEKLDERSIHVCTNCQGEFVGYTALVKHKEHCDKNPVVVIMGDDQKMTPPPPSQSRDPSPTNDAEKDKPSYDSQEDMSEQKTQEDVVPASEAVDFSSRDSPIDHLKEQHRYEPHDAYPSGLALLQEATQRARYEMGRLNESTLAKFHMDPPRFDIGVADLDPSHSRFDTRRHSFDGAFSHFEALQARIEASQAKYDTPLSALHSETHAPSEGEKKAEGSRSNGGKIPSLEDVTVIQEQLYKLHQQHIEQLQLIQQIQQQIQTLVSVSLQAPKEPVRETKEPTSKPSIPVPKASEPDISTPKQQQPTPPISHPVMPSSLEILQSQSRSSLPYPPFPLPPSHHSPFDLFQPQNPLQSVSNPLQVPQPLPYPGGLLAHRKGKPPNVSVFDPKFTDDAFFRHKCHFCHKVFGSDSALQIHIRSHTGERPFKCNICGNRFSTKGNLKVHFQRHQAAYPNVEMDVTPHPPSPTPADHPLQPPSIDQIPMPTIPNESKPNHGPGLGPKENNMMTRPNDPGTVEVNNNEKTMDILKNNTPKVGEDSGESEETANESDRPSSAPSKVLGASSPSNSSPIQPPPSHSAEELYNKVKSAGPSANKPPDSAELLSKASETSKLQDLVESIEQKITEPNQCVICHRVLSCKSALQLHYRIHTGERPFKCKICSRTFTTKGNLKNHLGVHHRHPVRETHECPICQKSFGNPVVLQQHLKLHAAEGYMVPKRSSDIAHSMFSPYYDPPESRHYSEGNFMESLRARFGDLRSHLMMNGNFKDEEKMGGRKPDRSEEEENTSVKRLKRDEGEERGEGSHEEAVNGEEGRGTEEEEGLKEEHADKESSEASGSYAPSPFSEERKLHIDENSQDEDLEKMSGGYGSSEIARMNAMYATSNGQLVPKSESLGSISPEPSGAGSDTSKNSDGLPYDPSFPSFLMGRRMHSRSNTMCHYCGKTFACASALNIHYRSHTKERPFKCDVCGKGFSTRGNLKQHMLTHKIRDMPSQLLGLPASPPTSVSPPPPEVSVAATTARMKLSPTNSSEDGSTSRRLASNRHACNVCGKQFQSDSALQIHVRTHTGEKPYKCHICGRAFTTKGNMKVHLGTHMWNGGSRRGRRITLDTPLLMKNDSDMYRSEFMGFRPGIDFPFLPYPSQYPMLNGFNPLTKSNEISVIQNPHGSGLPLPPSTEALLMKAHRSISPDRETPNYISSGEKQRNGSPDNQRINSETNNSSEISGTDMVKQALLSPSVGRMALDTNGDVKHGSFPHLTATSPGLAASYLRHQTEFLEKQMSHPEAFSPRYIPYRHDVSLPSDMKGGSFSRSNSASPGAAVIRGNDSNGDLINFPRPGSSSPGSASRERTSPYIPSSSASSHSKPSPQEAYDYMRHNMDALAERRSIEEDSLKGASRLVEQIQAQRV